MLFYSQKATTTLPGVLNCAPPLRSSRWTDFHPHNIDCQWQNKKPTQSSHHLQVSPSGPSSTTPLPYPCVLAPIPLI